MAGFKGGFGGFGGGNQMQQLMKQAQKMQEQMQKAQEELEEAEIEGTSGGGAVTVTMNGKKVVSAIKLDAAGVDTDDIEIRDDQSLAAYNDALHKAEKLSNEKLGGMPGAGGMF